MSLGKAVERSRHDQAHRVQSGLGGEAPAGEEEPVVEEGRHHRRRGLARMKVDRQVLRLRRLEDRLVLGGVEILAHRVRVDDDAVEAKLGGALDLARRFHGLLRRDRSQAGKSRRMSLHGVRKRVVGLGRQSRRQRALEHLDARRGEREDLHVDADLIHVSDAAGADIEQAIVERLVGRSLRQDGLAHLGESGLDVLAGQHDVPLRHDLGRNERLLDRDSPNSHGRLPFRTSRAHKRAPAEASSWPAATNGASEA